MLNENNGDASTSQNESTLTPRQRANRSNAQKSTGPRTPRGKGRSALNALKHGLFAEPTLATLSPANAKKYMALLGGLLVRYEPADMVEELLVQQMAHALWSDSRIQQWDLFAVERLVASLKQASTEIVSKIFISRDAERLAEYGARFRSCWYKAMMQLDRLKKERSSNGQQGSVQTHESGKPAAHNELK